MSERPPPTPTSARDAHLQRRLDEQAKPYRKQIRDAKNTLTQVMDTVIRLRRNPLARIFVKAGLLDEVRKAKKGLSSGSAQEQGSHARVAATGRPRRFGFSTEQLAAMTPEQAALVAGAVAEVVDQNLNVEFVSYIAAISAGDTTPDLFQYVGVEWLETLIRLCRLGSGQSVLDIGCGCGRMAGPLSLYLNDNGVYLGFDPSVKSVAFAQRHLQQANFRFEHVDLQHYLYNPGGTVDAGAFRFPCDDAAMDVALAASVFTHLDQKTAQHYLDEIGRVLRPGGRALISFFAITDDMAAPEGGITKPLGKGSGFGQFRFLNRGAGFYTHCHEDGSPANHHSSSDTVGDPVAFDLLQFKEMCRRSGCNVIEDLPGGWCREEYVHGYQDMLVLQKPAHHG